jgi:DNA repair exonuclease SbcCD ATPase subunit
VDNYDSEANDLRATTLTLNRKKQIVQDVKNLLVSCRETETSLTTMTEKFNSAEDLVKRVKEFKVELESLEDDITANTGESVSRQAVLDEVRLKIARYDEYTTDKGKLEEQLLVLQNIRMATDPVKGIPITMIDDYLIGVEQVANRLLDMSYNGSFRINFDLNEKDFLIQVQKDNGTTCGDVLIASQGQQAMTSTTLSFAIYQQALGRYNILCLDEIDSTLDEVNRRVFLEIIRKQIDTLGLEQVFIISHNDEFFSEQDIGLILLPGHTAPLDDELFATRKTIIADLDK